MLLKKTEPRIKKESGTMYDITLEFKQIRIAKLAIRTVEIRKGEVTVYTPEGTEEYTRTVKVGVVEEVGTYALKKIVNALAFPASLFPPFSKFTKEE
jgi:hypothetical protein